MDHLSKNYKALVHNAWKFFYLSHRTWAVAIEREGLTTASFPVLEMIVNHPGVTQQEITDQVSLDKSCTSRACKLLESKGFIRREKCLKAAHAFRCYPEEKAARIVKEIIESESAQLHDLFGAENPAELENSVQVLSRLIEQLQK